MTPEHTMTGAARLREALEDLSFAKDRIENDWSCHGFHEDGCPRCEAHRRLSRAARGIREALAVVPEAPEPDDFTDGRYVVAVTDADGARDPIGLTSQVKYMRDRFERLGLKPALILCVVADGEHDAATERIRAALEDRERVEEGTER